MDQKPGEILASSLHADWVTSWCMVSLDLWYLQILQDHLVKILKKKFKAYQTKKYLQNLHNFKTPSVFQNLFYICTKWADKKKNKIEI